MATYTYRIQMRRDAAADWTSNDPTLAEGEIGWETDTDLFKFGDGSTAWTSLNYHPSGNLTILDTKKLYIGTGEDGEIYASSDDLYIDNTTSNKDIYIRTSDGGTMSNSIFINGDNGKIGIEETAPDGWICINQGAEDDNILTFKSSDVAHGLVSVDETDTYGAMSKRDSAGGGVTILSITDGGESVPIGLVVATYVASTASTTTSTAGRGLIELTANQHDGADSVENVAADGNVLCVRRQSGGGNKTAFIIKGDGDIYYDGADQGAFDKEDDIALTEEARLMNNWDKKTINKNRKRLQELGVITEGGFISTRKTAALTFGAISQLVKRIDEMGQEITGLKKQLAEAK